MLFFIEHLSQYDNLRSWCPREADEGDDGADDQAHRARLGFLGKDSWAYNSCNAENAVYRREARMNDSVERQCTVGKLFCLA